MLGCDVVVTLYFIYNCGGDVCCETDETALLKNCIIVVLGCCVGDGRSLPCVFGKGYVVFILGIVERVCVARGISVQINGFLDGDFNVVYKFTCLFPL